MLYRREALRGRKWYRVVVERDKEEHRRIRRWLDDKLPSENFAYCCVLTHMVILFSDLEDMVLARLMFNFTPAEMRGCKEWIRRTEDREEQYRRAMEARIQSFKKQNAERRAKAINRE
jgi:hypothetical protein